MGQSQGVPSEAITSPARLTIVHLASAQSVPASAGRTTSHASLGPSGASIPRAAWNVTVNVGPLEKARKLSICPPLAATTAKPFPRARHVKNAIATTTMTRSSPQPSNRRRPDPGRASDGGVHDELLDPDALTGVTLARKRGKSPATSKQSKTRRSPAAVPPSKDLRRPALTAVDHGRPRNGRREWGETL